MASRRATCRTISAGDGPWSGRSSQVPRKPGSWPLYNRSQQPTQIEPQKNLPGLIDAVAREHPGERVELWFMDEARVGQKGGVTHVWYQKGVRPRGVRQQGFSSAYLFGAVCPERGEGVALVLPEVSTAAMGVFLAELAR